MGNSWLMCGVTAHVGEESVHSGGQPGMGCSSLMGEQGFCLVGQLHQANPPSQTSCSCSHLPSLGSRALQMPLKYFGAFSGSTSYAHKPVCQRQPSSSCPPLLVVLQRSHLVSALSQVPLVKIQCLSQQHSLHVPSC